MKNKTIKLVLFLITLSVLSSCDDKTTEINDDLFPMNVGNVWKYKSDTYIFEGIVRQDTFVREIKSIVSIGGKDYFKFYENLRSNDAAILYSTDDFGNVVTMGGISDCDTLMDSSVRFRKSVKAGDEWSYNFLDFNEDRLEFQKENVVVRCLNADTLISTPLGEFKCILYDIPMYANYYNVHYFLARNIGIVEIDYYVDGWLESQDQLIYYRLNKK